MPELPDLEVFKTNIFDQLTSKRLVGVKIFNSKKVYASKEVLALDLVGRDLICINRVGKELFFDFGDGKVISTHLMLNGTTSIVEEGAVSNIKFKIFSMQFEHDTIVFSDIGSLCTVKYMPIVSDTPDALSSAFTLEYFLDIARRKSRTNVKAFLINQKIVKGIGNAYVDEILWVARISPHSLVGKIPEDKLKELYHGISTVLREATLQIKRISPNIISGEERSFLKVHNRKIKKTETGYPIIVEKIASKTTYYTEEQVLYS